MFVLTEALYFNFFLNKSTSVFLPPLFLQWLKIWRLWFRFWSFQSKSELHYKELPFLLKCIILPVADLSQRFILSQSMWVVLLNVFWILSQQMPSVLFSCCMNLLSFLSLDFKCVRVRACVCLKFCCLFLTCLNVFSFHLKIIVFLTSFQEAVTMLARVCYSV